MKSSNILDTSRRPVGSFDGAPYAPKDKNVLEALHRAQANMTVGLSMSYPDTSVYEFPGDATYARYLRNGS